MFDHHPAKATALRLDDLRPPGLAPYQLEPTVFWGRLPVHVYATAGARQGSVRCSICGQLMQGKAEALRCLRLQYDLRARD
jgi:hypothetical protein